MTLYQGKLHLGKYFELAGQMWDLCMISRKSGDNEQIFNGRIDDINNANKLLPKHQAWFATIGTHAPKLAEDTPESWQVCWHAKTYIFIYDSLFKGDEMPRVGVWEQVDFVWVSDDKVFTRWNGDNLNYRFRQLNSVEVANVLGEEPPTPPTPPVEEEDPPVIPPAQTTGTTIHMVCPHCNKVIF